MACKFALHDRLAQKPQFRPTRSELRYEIVERFLLDLWEDDLPHDAGDGIVMTVRRLARLEKGVRVLGGPA